MNRLFQIIALWYYDEKRFIFSGMNFFSELLRAITKVLHFVTQERKHQFKNFKSISSKKELNSCKAEESKDWDSIDLNYFQKGRSMRAIPGPLRPVSIEAGSIDQLSVAGL